MATSKKADEAKKTDEAKAATDEALDTERREAEVIRRPTEHDNPATQFDTGLPSESMQELERQAAEREAAGSERNRHGSSSSSDSSAEGTEG